MARARPDYHGSDKHLRACEPCEGTGHLEIFHRSPDGGYYGHGERGTCADCDGSGEVCRYCGSWSCPGDCDEALAGDCSAALEVR